MITNLDQYRKRKSRKKLQHNLKMTALCVCITFFAVSLASVFTTNVSTIMSNYEWQPAIVLGDLDTSVYFE